MAARKRIDESEAQWRARFDAATGAEREAMLADGVGENLIADDLLADEEKPQPLYGELLGILPDGSYGVLEGGRRHAAGAELEALFARERARGNSHNVAVTFSDGSRVRPDRFAGDGSDATTDAVTGDLLLDGMRMTSATKGK